jgi:hypothetical protein
MGEQTMIDSRLYDQRDEFFDDIQEGDMVYYQDSKNRVRQGWARVLDHTFWAWHVQTDGVSELVCVIEDGNYLGHISRNQLTGVAA